ncbi:hypothetical protein CHELA40_10330 [Chelatococcus asaccharovorans]|nr:hypothetical protein CHELA40_10330 [Chelatococcus asaccharovorans]CAH1686801.1 hypothetical protein CHELA17_65278 [Chelatococcus asaccharovorans]
MAGLVVEVGLADFNVSNAKLGNSRVPLPSRFTEAPFRSGSPELGCCRVPDHKPKFG